MRSVPVVCALAVSACLGTPPALEVDAAIDGPDAEVDAPIDAPMCRDEDGDGWPVDCGGRKFFDCDDTLAGVHPGAFEAVGTSNDCNGDDVTMNEGFDDLEIAPFAVTGQTITSQFGRYVLRPDAGHQLGSVTVYLQSGVLSEELIYGGPQLREMFSGVHVWDDFLAVAPDASNLAETDPPVRGPVIYQAIVHYWAGGTDQDRSLDGFSIYTFTIDGRIIRTDQLDLRAQPPHTGSNDYPGITSHLSLAARGPTTGNTNLDTLVVRDSSSGVLSTPLLTNPIIYSLGDPARWQWSCATGAEVEVGFVPSIPVFNGQPTRQARATTNVGFAPPYRQIALQYDWQQGVLQGDPPMPPATLTLGAQRGHFMFVPRGRTGAGCPAVDQQAMGYLFPAPLAFGSPATATILTSDPGDDNADGYSEGGGYWNVQATDPSVLRISQVSMVGRYAPPHPLFRIRGLPAGIDPVVSANGQRLIHGQHYRLQADGTSGVWLSVMSGLPYGHELVLEYPAPCDAACAK